MRVSAHTASLAPLHWQAASSLAADWQGRGSMCRHLCIRLAASVSAAWPPGWPQQIQTAPLSWTGASILSLRYACQLCLPCKQARGWPGSHVACHATACWSCQWAQLAAIAQTADAGASQVVVMASPPAASLSVRPSRRRHCCCLCVASASAVSAMHVSCACCTAQCEQTPTPHPRTMSQAGRHGRGRQMLAASLLSLAHEDGCTGLLWHQHLQPLLCLSVLPAMQASCHANEGPSLALCSSACHSHACQHSQLAGIPEVTDAGASKCSWVHLHLLPASLLSLADGDGATGTLWRQHLRPLLCLMLCLQHRQDYWT